MVLVGVLVIDDVNVRVAVFVAVAVAVAVRVAVFVGVSVTVSVGVTVGVRDGVNDAAAFKTGAALFICGKIGPRKDASARHSLPLNVPAPFHTKTHNAIMMSARRIS